LGLLFFRDNADCLMEIGLVAVDIFNFFFKFYVDYLLIFFRKNDDKF